MGFSVYLPSRKMVGNIEFNKDYLTEKVLHDIQPCVMLHVVTNLFC